MKQSHIIALIVLAVVAYLFLFKKGKFSFDIADKVLNTKAPVPGTGYVGATGSGSYFDEETD